MKKILLILSLCSSLYGSSSADILSDKLPEDNGRYDTFAAALDLLFEKKARVIVETGTERWENAEYCFSGDGGATIIFGHWAYENNAALYSVDICPVHVGYAKANTAKYENHVEIVCDDSVAFLKTFSSPIDFLYLDSWDYDLDDPAPAQNHCLNEVLAAYDKLSEDAFIMIDDCNVPGGGKGKLAIEWLLEQGWLLHTNRHHVILVKP